MANEKKIPINAQVPKELGDKIKQKSKDTGISITRLVTDALRFKMAILEGDAEKEADQFFNQIQVKTKKLGLAFRPRKV